MTNLVIDTDVILDFFFDRQPFSESAALILSMCERKELKGYVTPVILSNVYYLLRQTAKHEKVVEKLAKLVSITEILVIDRQAVINAMQSEFRDFEDALQNYSAELNSEITLIITRNLKDYKRSSLGVMTPDTYLNTISNN